MFTGRNHSSVEARNSFLPYGKVPLGLLVSSRVTLMALMRLADGSAMNATSWNSAGKLSPR